MNTKKVKGSHPLYHTWGWMKKMTRKYHMDETWHKDFWAFVEDMGERPTSKHQIRRKDKTKGYNKYNCEWVEVLSSSKDKNEYARKWREANPDTNETHIKRCRAKKYGMTLEEYEKLLEKYDRKCAICKEPDESRMLSIDHCHKTSKVRGLLCTKCNSVIGFASDDVNILSSAIEYLT